MAKDVYLLSTLTAPQLYTTYKQGGADLPVVEHQISVAGGANIPDKRLITPQGVVTRVTADELELLKTNHVFNLHVENGYITVSNSKPADADAAAASQANRSPDAPLTDADFEPGKGPATPGAPETPAAVPQRTVAAPAASNNPRRA